VDLLVASGQVLGRALHRRAFTLCIRFRQRDATARLRLIHGYRARRVRAASGVALGGSYANMTPVIAKPVKQEYKYAAITI
jgi:hypothetical protein